MCKATLPIWVSAYLLLTLPCFSQVAPELQHEFDSALDNYKQCVFPKAIELARMSEETAEVIRQAAVAACYRQRDAVADILRRNGADEADIRELDNHVGAQLLLAVVSTRANKNPR